MMRATLLLLIFTAISSCKEKSTSASLDPILAQASGHNLRVSDMKGMFPEGSTMQDSQQIINTYVDQWTRESVLLGEAEDYVSNRIDIKKLVEKYRESLIVHNYEKQLVKERLDTVVTLTQMETVYDAMKDRFQLSSPIVKAIYAIMPDNASDIASFKKSWIKEDGQAMLNYCEQYGNSYHFYDSIWIAESEILQKIPEDLFSTTQLKSKKALDKVKDGSHYFVKVYERMDENEEAPLGYIEDKIEKIILHNRKISMLDDIKQKLYEREQKEGNIKVYPLN